MKYLIAVLCFIFSCNTFAIRIANETSPNALLNEPFYIYTNGTTASVRNFPGAQRVLLPINNQYKDSPGCYIACYSHAQGVYPFGKNMSVMGMVRVKGNYRNTSCLPLNYHKPDMSADPFYKELCNQSFQSCKKGCWAGGNTGGFVLNQ